MTKIQQLEKQIKDWKIKYDNLRIAKEISENSLKEEIDGLKKELAKKDRLIVDLYSIINKLDAKVDALTVELEAVKKENIELKEKIAEQNDQISNLKARLNKDSTNSSKPSSTDEFKKSIQNNREKSGKKPGGQKGHKGSKLNLFNNPTEITYKEVLTCDSCQSSVRQTQRFESKQLVDIEIKLHIYEERAVIGICEKCGKVHIGKFSENYINPVQYGSGIKSLISILNTHGFVSINKTTDIINSITNNRLNISQGTLINIQKTLAKRLENTVETIKQNLIKSKVLNADETGCRVDSKLQWVQVFSNRKFTLFNYNKNRSAAATKEVGILEYFVGILVHDHFSSYYKNKLATHSECNAHILRYLKNVIEVFKREWAKEMIELLVQVHNEKKELILSNKLELGASRLNEISQQYDTILEKGKAAYEEAIKNKKNKKYFNDERLLLKRLEEFKKEHLLFATNFDAPFDNNQAERDIRPFKTKTKVSGCFRSEDGIKSFTQIASVISTLRKHKLNIFKNIKDVFDNKNLVFQ